MAGYCPAGYLPAEPKSWWQRHRDKKAERRRTFIKAMSMFMNYTPEERRTFFFFLDQMSTHDLLCKSGQESWRKP